MQVDVPEYFNHPFLKKDKVNYRHYQDNILKKCKNKNSLVVLPTGLGKTIVGILMIAHCLKKYKSLGKIIIMAPTRPLVFQHTSSCEKFLNLKTEEISQLTGKVSPEKRIQLFESSRVIISTPQVIKNDLLRGRYELKQVSLIIFDEAHRTKGNYAYNFISSEYINSCSDPLILGLTASPGKDYDHIQLLCNNLCIENIVFKTYEDEDVLDYIYDIDLFVERIDLPVKILELSQVWDHLFKKFLRFFIKGDLINPYKKYYSKLDFLRITHDLTLSLNYENCHDKEELEEEYIDQLYFQSPKIIDSVKENNLNIQSIFSYCSSCISILHAKDLLETQEISLFNSFLEKLKYKSNQDISSASRIVNSKHYQLVKTIIEKQIELGICHPKIDKIISLINGEIREFQNKKLIIFTQYREMAEFLKNKLTNEYTNQLVVEKFIGQTTKFNDFGYSQSTQIEILQDFREDKINILIATSVAEEGLDIPNVDAVFFYEPVPSEIRLIQRRGRTGRFASGRCYILVTEGTVDIPFYIVARRKENAMNSVLSDPEQLELTQDLKRKKIDFSNKINACSEFEYVKNFKERRDKEKELLANRSIEEIITELDNFTQSKEYQELKNYGVTFLSDVITIKEEKLRKDLLKLKGRKNQGIKEKKRYLNRNLKTLIDIVNTYSHDGKMLFSEFQDLAEDEEIIEKKFFGFFNQACYLGYLKKEKDFVRIIKHYS